MIKGSTVIMSEEYIDELQRHLAKWKKRFELETQVKERNKCEKEISMYEAKIDKALSYQDTIEEILHIDIPRLTAVKTVGGKTFPITHVQVI